jgi:hypothetical protein
MNPTTAIQDEPVTDDLESLVGAELEAAEVCGRALSRFRSSTEAKELRRIQQEHREAANELRHFEANQFRPRPLRGPLSHIVRGIAHLGERLSTRVALKALTRAEDACFRLYKDAVFCNQLPVECQAFIWSTLLPRREAHRRTLNDLCAGR